MVTAPAALPSFTRAIGATPRIALVGNPNAGKTTLFNALTGLRAKTANFPGTTLEIRLGRMRGELRDLQLIDMPGLYSLLAVSAEERLALGGLLGTLPDSQAPHAVVLLLDATNLERNLYLASQILELGVPTIVALNMIDSAEYEGIRIDAGALAKALGCEVYPMSARSGRGVRELEEAIARLFKQGDLNHAAPAPVLPLDAAGGVPGAERQRYDWAESIAAGCVAAGSRPAHTLAKSIDRILTHPVMGVVAFFAVMLAVFYLIFSVAAVPMGLIEGWCGALGEWLGSVLPEGDLRSLVVDGIVGGVGGVLVFLPQICILFFFIALLEDSGYMARAAFVMDRLMQRVGLPGKAFVPMLSAHACAIPAIMSTRAIEDKRDRLITIMILPLLTCSARIPVYTMVTALLFPGHPGLSALVFTGAYSLGLLAAIAAAFVLRRTVLRGETQPLAIELPDYHIPSFRIAGICMLDRARVFLRRAGTVILGVAIVLWWLVNYPRPNIETPAGTMTDGSQVSSMDQKELDRVRMENSYAGRLGHWIEPVVRPLGFDWRLGVGVISSFAAREVVVSTLSILYGMGSESEDTQPLYERMRASRRPDGRPVFSIAASVSLLVFYVLAMQCLATQAVTKRETGRWTWAAFQFGYMTVLAYTAALVVYQALKLFGLDAIGSIGA